MVTLGLYLAVLADLTLVQFHQFNPGWNLVPGATIVQDLRVGGFAFLVNTLGNVAATVPLGFLLPVVFGARFATALRVALASFGLSLAIELAQLALRLRFADVDDLSLNTLGGLLGYGLFRFSIAIGPKRRTRSGSAQEGPRAAARRQGSVESDSGSLGA